MTSDIIGQIVVLVVLLLLSAFFSSAETALTTIGALRVRTLLEEKVRGAESVRKLTESPSRMLNTILVGNNIVNIIASSLTTTISLAIGGDYSVAIGTGLVTLVILIFGEITPKTLATIYAEKLALVYAPIILFLNYVLAPISFVTSKLSLGFLLLLRVNPRKTGAAITENELRTIVDVSHEEGVIESDERKMITNVVDFGDSLAKDIMVPRIDMAFASADMTYDELLDTFRKEEYSRLPVYSETYDNIIGIIILKDVFLNYNPNTPFNIKSYLRKPYFTYEYKKTAELMREMRKKQLSISIVLDEYGATAGLITLEDLLEEIVGEIRDEYDSDETDRIRRISPNEYLVDGTAKLEEINEQLKLSLESDDYDSIAGHIINLLGHLPTEGEQIQEGDTIYTVTSVDKNRIDEIHILLASPDSESEE